MCGCGLFVSTKCKLIIFARVNGSAFELEDRGQSGKNEVKVSCFGKRCVVLMIMYLRPMEQKVSRG